MAKPLVLDELWEIVESLLPPSAVLVTRGNCRGNRFRR